MNDEIEVSGLKTDYRVVGQGEPVMILHGWGSRAEAWSEVQNQISKAGFNVVVPDLIGFGQSQTPPRGWNMNDYADWFENFVGKLAEKHPEFNNRFFLVGHSFGGRISVKIAARHSLELSGLVLCGAAGLKSDTSLKLQIISGVAKSASGLMDRMRLNKLKDPVRDFYYHLLRQNDYLKVPPTMRDTFRLVIEEDLSGCLPMIELPTLIVWGSEDRIVPVKQAYRFHQGIKNSRMEIYPGVGHAPHLEQPNELARTLVGFFRKTN